MGWSHPDISLDDLMALIKGFVDILILASGYRSSGLPATWDVDNIKKAIRWGIFFEEVFKRLEATDHFEESVKEFDAALVKLTSNSFFPQGLSYISSACLSNARCLVIEHLLETNPLKDAHLVTLLTAAIEVDANNITDSNNDGPNAYINRLLLKIQSLNLVSAKNISKNYSPVSSIVGSMNSRPSNPEIHIEACGASNRDDSFDCSHLVIEKLLKRRTSVTCLSLLEASMDNFSKIVTRSKLVDFESTPLKKLPRNNFSPQKEEMFSELCCWNQWKSKCLSYLLDKRTIRMISGSNLIFSAPKLQWSRILEQLKFSVDAHTDNLLEIVEILLLGFISSRWTSLVDHFISHPCDFVPTSKQFSDVHHLLQGYSWALHSKMEAMISKEKDIIEYLTQLLETHPQKLWQVPPVLAAMAIPPGSVVFRMYINDIEKQFGEESSPIRCCTCSQGTKEHRSCELAERIRCLYVFHIQGSNLMVDNSST